jgi:hypothetical protein
MERERTLDTNAERYAANSYRFADTSAFSGDYVAFKALHSLSRAFNDLDQYLYGIADPISGRSARMFSFSIAFMTLSIMLIPPLLAGVHNRKIIEKRTALNQLWNYNTRVNAWQ